MDSALNVAVEFTLTVNSDARLGYRGRLRAVLALPVELAFEQAEDADGEGEEIWF